MTFKYLVAGCLLGLLGDPVAAECIDGICAATSRVLLQHKQSVDTLSGEEESDMKGAEGFAQVQQARLGIEDKLQKLRKSSRAKMRAAAAGSAWFAWVADSYSDCIACAAGPMQVRSVNCLRVYDGSEVSEALCSEYPKPVTSVPCDCAVLPCNPNITSLCALDIQGCQAESSLDDDFIELGCFDRAANHQVSTVPASAYDWSCMNYTGTTPCMSGLPFYSMRSNAMTPGLCYEFCTGKGLDIFALVNGEECRCGASAVNTNSRDENIDTRHLEFDPAVLAPHTGDMGLCPLRLYRYAGHFEGGGVPFGITELLEGDSEYIRSIYAGRKLEHSEDAPANYVPPTPNPAYLQDGSQTGDSQTPQTGYNRDCWPDNCGPGRGPWQDRQTALPPGVTTRRFVEYVVIPYHFEDGLDNTRKEAFRVAVQRWHAKTCIALVEKLAADISRPYIKVGEYDSGSCYLAGMGWPGFYGGTPRYSRINLGWCNDMSAVGSMVHEIGHAIGMNHEQKRPDAQQVYNGHGPHLIMHWQNIDASWVSQYTPDTSSYIGSTNQGRVACMRDLVHFPATVWFISGVKTYTPFSWSDWKAFRVFTRLWTLWSIVMYFLGETILDSCASRERHTSTRAHERDYIYCIGCDGGS